MSLISIIIPTIDGRERWLKNSLETFEQRTNVPIEFIVIENKETCGIAWNEGLAQAKGDYVLLSADDIEPATANWWEVGMYWADKGYLPCARILNTDGTIQSCGNSSEEEDTGVICEFARIPFGNRKQIDAIGDIIETHYATDLWFSYQGRVNGWPTVVVREFLFYHHYANVGRVDDRFNADMKEYERRTSKKYRNPNVYYIPLVLSET